MVVQKDVWQVCIDRLKSKMGEVACTRQERGERGGGGGLNEYEKIKGKSVR